MSKYIMRIDDACEKRDVEKWNKIEFLFDKFGIKPLVGVIPHCEDPMMDQYDYDEKFWDRVDEWQKKGWTIAMHGYNHVYSTSYGGINPVNKRSEFAGEPLKIQKQKICNGMAIMHSHKINPQVFFAPAHTFDENTIIALKEESNIRIVSDTIASKPYLEYGMTFVPQQSGHVRKIPLSMITFCYHPNSMLKNDFNKLEGFINHNRKNIIDFPLDEAANSKGLLDIVLKRLYFMRR